MAKPFSSEEQRIILPAGSLLFRQEDGSGNLKSGQRYLGLTPGFTLNVAAESVEIPDDDEAIEETYETFNTKTVRAGQLIVKNMTYPNFALFFQGDASDITQASGSVTGETHPAIEPGYYYQLGESGDIAGARNISAVALTFSDAGSYVAGTDYIIDLVEGTVFIAATGTLADAINAAPGTIGFDADYTKAEKTYKQLISNSNGTIDGALYFRADAPKGRNDNVRIMKVTLIPNGDITFKSRTDPQQMTFDVKIGTRTGFEQLYIDERAVA